MSKFAVFGLHGSDLFYVIIIKINNLSGYQAVTQPYLEGIPISLGNWISPSLSGRQ